jgi:hypothetical protein
MQLASNLIRVGMPFISNFLPSAKKGFWGKEPDPWPSVIPLNPNPTQKDISEAEKDLKLVAKDLTWHANDVLYPKWKYLGTTRLAASDHPWENEDTGTILASDMQLESEGKLRRPLTMGIMKEYVTAIKTSDPTSERNIRATFMAAITMAHEVGHAIFHNDLRSFSSQREPYIGDDCEAEVGFSFIAWIFSGFNPQYTPDDVEFRNTLYWSPQYTLSMGKRPLDSTYYSIPISYLERLLSQEFWDGLGPPEQPQFSERARKELRPNTDENSSQVATGTVPNWSYSHLHDRPKWNDQYHFRMPGFKERDRIKGLTREEVQHAYDLTKDEPKNRLYRSMSKEERKMRYQQQRVSKLVGPPSQDDTETGLEDEQEYIPTTSKAPNPPQPPQQNPFQDESDDEIWGPPVKRLKANSTVKSISDLISRGMDIDALVNEPGPGPRRRRKLGTNIMDEIEDYEEVIDLTKELEIERAVKQEEQRRPRRRRAANAQPRAPPSHMKDIYEVIVIEDDDE